MKLKVFNKFNELLTSYGLKQIFERGEEIMKRYQTLMNNTDINSISTRSSFKSRARLSALSQLLGMFGSSECKNEMKSFTSANRTLEIETLDDVSQKLRECLSEFLPYVNVDEDPNNIFNLKLANGTLYSKITKAFTEEELQIRSNLEQKILVWTNEYYPIEKNNVVEFGKTIRGLYAHDIKFIQKLKINHSEIIEFCIKYNYEQKRHDVAANQIVSLLYGNEQLKYIMSAIELAAKQYQSGLNVDPAYYFDSGHDSNIYAIMIHLGNEERIPLKFGCSLFFELHEDDTSHKLYAKIFLDNDQLLNHRSESYLEFNDEIKTSEKLQFMQTCL